MALKRIEKVGNQLSREYEILHMIKGVANVVQMEVLVERGRTSSTPRTTRTNSSRTSSSNLEDNLESLIERTYKAKTRLAESTVKVLPL